MLQLDEAQALLLAEVETLPAERVAVRDAQDRYLAEPLVARRQQPAADLSAMDGYAIAAGDDAGPWTVIGESAAGHPFAGRLDNGQAVRISTGAVLPQGAGAVLLQENAARDGDRLRLDGRDGPSRRHIRRAGFDFAQGDVLLPAGTALGPAHLALALMAGHAELAVHAKPSLTVIDSGDELVRDPAEAVGARIPATNGAMIAAMARGLVSRCEQVGPVADSRDVLMARFAEARSDVIVITGGASVGDHDLVRPALEAWGAELAFWKVAIRPGKPLMVARKGPQTVLGLPGNPASAYVTALLFLLPLLRHLGGSREPLPQSLRLPLTVDLPEGGPRAELVRSLTGPDGVTPIMQRDSSAVAALAAADALIRRDIDAPAACAGDLVTVYLLRNGGTA